MPGIGSAMASKPPAKASEKTPTIKNTSEAPQSSMSTTERKLRLLKRIRQCLGSWDQWLPRQVHLPTCIEDWSLPLLRCLSKTCRILETSSARGHYTMLIRRSMEDAGRTRLEMFDVHKISQRLERRHSCVEGIKTIWGGESAAWVGHEFEIQERDPMTWPTDIVGALLNLARQAPTPGRHLRAKRIVYDIAARDLDMLEEEGMNFLPLHVQHVNQACERFAKLWPASTNTNLTGTLRNSAPNSPAPDSIEDFGAYDQLCPEDQARADHAVLAAYQNALNGRGAGYGSPQHGPTICTREFAEAKGLGRCSASIGPLWKAPNVEGEKRSYGKVLRKQSYMRNLESHYGCTFAQFLEIPRLRPEEAFYFAENALKALVKLKDEFPDLPLQNVREALEKQNKIVNESKRSSNKSSYYNITEGTIIATRAVLRAEAESTTLDAASEDLAHTEEHVGVGEHADAAEHVVVAMEPAATEAATTEAPTTEPAAAEAAEAPEAVEAAVEVADNDVDNSDCSQFSLFNDRPRKRKRADSVMNMQKTRLNLCSVRGVRGVVA